MTDDLIAQVNIVAEELDELKQTKARQEGKRETNMASLKRVFGVESIEEAKKLRDRKVAKKATLSENIATVKNNLQKVIDENKARLNG